MIEVLVIICHIAYFQSALTHAKLCKYLAHLTLPGWKQMIHTYSVFHQFRLGKFAYGGSIFKIKPIFTTALLASKNDAWYKSGQNLLEKNHLTTLI